MEWTVPVVKGLMIDLVGTQRGSNATFREEGLGSKQDMTDREWDGRDAPGGGSGRRASTVSPLSECLRVSSIFLSPAPRSGTAGNAFQGCIQGVQSYGTEGK